MSERTDAMWNFINSRFFMAISITIFMPIIFYLLLIFGSQPISTAITAGIGDAITDIAKGNNKKTIQEIVSGFTNQLINGFKAPFADMQKDQEVKNNEILELMDNLQVDNIKIIPDNWGGIKIIGTIHNNSIYVIEQIHLTVSTYDDRDILQNVSNEWISDIKFIKSKESENFSVSPNALRTGKNVESIQPARVDVKVSSASIMKSIKK